MIAIPLPAKLVSLTNLLNLEGDMYLCGGAGPLFILFLPLNGPKIKSSNLAV